MENLNEFQNPTILLDMKHNELYASSNLRKWSRLATNYLSNEQFIAFSPTLQDLAKLKLLSEIRDSFRPIVLPNFIRCFFLEGGERYSVVLKNQSGLEKTFAVDYYSLFSYYLKQMVERLHVDVSAPFSLKVCVPVDDAACTHQLSTMLQCMFPTAATAIAPLTSLVAPYVSFMPLDTELLLHKSHFCGIGSNLVVLQLIKLITHQFGEELCEELVPDPALLATRFAANQRQLRLKIPQHQKNSQQDAGESGFFTIQQNELIVTDRAIQHCHAGFRELFFEQASLSIKKQLRELRVERAVRQYGKQRPTITVVEPLGSAVDIPTLVARLRDEFDEADFAELNRTAVEKQLAQLQCEPKPIKKDEQINHNISIDEKNEMIVDDLANQRNDEKERIEKYMREINRLHQDVMDKQDALALARSAVPRRDTMLYSTNTLQKQIDRVYLHKNIHISILKSKMNLISSQKVE